MSTALAIGATSAVLRNVLDNGLVDAGPAVGGTVKVSAVAPDLIKTDDAQAVPRLNLFLYRVSQNAGLRNAALPTYDGGGSRIANAPLALDLHYLLTAYGREDLQAEILLGYGMHLLHERSFLDRAAIRKALGPGALDTTLLPDAFRDPPTAGLADQLETVKISWEPLDLDALSKLWSAAQTHYRPSAAYQVSVLLIEATRPARAALPVLVREVSVEASLVPPFPTIDQVVSADQSQVAELGEQVQLRGHHLAGTAVKLHLGHRLLAVPHEIPLPDNAEPALITFTLPAAEPVGQPWPAGAWSVSATLTPPGEPGPRTTNSTVFLLAPVPDAAATVVTRDGVTQRVTVEAPVTPTVQPEQPVILALNTAEATPAPRTAPVSTVKATFGLVPAGAGTTLRVRVDGVDSRIIDRGGATPVLRADRQVTVP